MNSEELEISLRTEFENYLKNVFAEMQQEISGLQAKIETELENYKSQLDGVFKEALKRAESTPEFDAGFKDSVVEHLRLARDEGARITATAFAEAEKMDKMSFESPAAERSVPAAGIKQLHAAISDISSKNSQAEILKTLVDHASQFAPRGAFFIIKNEHFVGWKTFGDDNGINEETVRDIDLPILSDSIFSEAVRSLSTVESTSEVYTDDAAILEKLQFGAPDKMFAVPLIARSRGVAVLYADYGNEGKEVNVEALEAMVRVAGLTVEILASARGTAPKKKSAPEHSEDFSSKEPPKETVQAETGFAASYPVTVSEPAETLPQESFKSDAHAEESPHSVEPSSADESHDFDSGNAVATQTEEDKNSQEDSGNSAKDETAYPTYEDSAWKQPAESFRAVEEENFAPEKSSDDSHEHSLPEVSAHEVYVKEDNSSSANHSFEPAAKTEHQMNNDSPVYSMKDFQIEKPKDESSDYFVPQTETFAPESKSIETGGAKKETKSAEQPVSTKPAKSRLSERNVDLPIEVSEDERRLHNDARRFARLLVSEIKLYNEQKVKEGREANDLYERLREAIDRSREMYDKRVQPPVAAKFDYFNYELVNSLAEGDAAKLGESYQMQSV